MISGTGPIGALANEPRLAHAPERYRWQTGQ
jgi:hypothetical protein